jgi:pyruvate/2-oxoglutarate dehydrogenase complex dihydrolipoamide dehydrogenase (E3) component
MPERKHYDAIVIGSGQGGTPLAAALARTGRATALIEREHVGGTCVNVGCTPTKTMVARRARYATRRATDYGVHTGPVTVHLDEVRQRKRAIVTSFRSGSERRLEATENLDLVRGEARFTGPRAIEVCGDDGVTHPMASDMIFINTGDRPVTPKLTGLAEVPALDSTSIMELDAVPEHLLVLGGGYVGLEFAQMFRRFGSRVTIVQRAKQLLPREDADVAETIASILRDDGIAVFLETEALQVERTAPDAQGLGLSVRTPEGERTLRGSHLCPASMPWATPRGGPAFTHISYEAQYQGSCYEVPSECSPMAD